MEQITLAATKRPERGKVHARLARSKGAVPAIIYGKKMDTVPLSIQAQALEKALAHGAAHKIVNLKIETGGAREEKLCLIHEIQKDVFGRRLLHVDFHHISMQDKITAKVPVELKGEPTGAKEGGILDHVLWELEVEALPANLPEKLTADVSSLAINQALHVKDVKLPEGVEVLDDPEEVVAVVHPPRAEEVAVAAPSAEGTTAEAAATPAQPEVISKGKKEEDLVEEKPEKPEKAEKSKK